MYKKIPKEEKITRNINDTHSADNYLTKEITENVSLAVTKLDGKIEPEKLTNERVYYFINADVNFIIGNDIIHCNSGDVLYMDKNTIYSGEGYFEAVTINVPAFGVIK